MSREDINQISLETSGVHCFIYLYKDIHTSGTCAQAHTTRILRRSRRRRWRRRSRKGGYEEGGDRQVVKGGEGGGEEGGGVMVMEGGGLARAASVLRG